MFFYVFCFFMFSVLFSPFFYSFSQTKQKTPQKTKNVRELSQGNHPVLSVRRRLRWRWYKLEKTEHKEKTIEDRLEQVESDIENIKKILSEILDAMSKMGL